MKIKNTIGILLILIIASSCRSFLIENDYYELSLNKKNGSINYLKKGTNFIINQLNKQTPLFVFKLKDDTAKITFLYSFEADDFKMNRKNSDDTIFISLEYRYNKIPFTTQVTIKCPVNDSLTYWSLKFNNQSDLWVEQVQFPYVSITNNCIQGGDQKLFFPRGDGVVVDDLKSMFKNGPDLPDTYPGFCSMQLLACYSPAGGLYYSAHDDKGNPKTIGYIYEKEDSTTIHLDYWLFTDGMKKGEYELKYDMVLGVFNGEWQEAALIYRNWIKSTFMLPPLLKDNKLIPSWFEESPVTVSYPIRGTHSYGDMTPNRDYYPYINALPFIEKLGKQFDSKMIALVMHWEGSAPWAPPYIWPPFGGAEGLIKYSKALHEKGHLLGLYSSGIAYALRSNTLNYSNEKDYYDNHLENIMDIGPDGKLHESWICSIQRKGYDMCPYVGKTKEIMVNELRKVLASGVDYFQYFDQNLGGASQYCFSHEHGHPWGPGRWLSESMFELYNRTNKVIEGTHRNTILAAEAVASDYFLKQIPVNESRNIWSFRTGTPVPAYAFVLHEYTNNLMGNQCWDIFDVKKNPMSYNQRFAYSFVSGDMFMVVIRNGGIIDWNFEYGWRDYNPDQKMISTLIKNLNSWRKNIAKEFLCYGRMERSYPLEGLINTPIYYNGGDSLNFPNLFTSRWISQSGREVQIIANPFNEKQKCTLNCKNNNAKKIIIYLSSDGKIMKEYEKTDNLKLVIDPLTAIMIEFLN